MTMRMMSSRNWRSVLVLPWLAAAFGLAHGAGMGRNLGSSILALDGLLSGVGNEKKKIPKFIMQQHHRQLFAQAHSPLGDEAARLMQKKESDRPDCDAAFMICLGEQTCVDCFLELENKGVDWTSVTKDTKCEDVVQYLYKGKHCTSMKGVKEYETEFCNTYNACVVWNDDGGSKKKDDKDKVDCDKLTSCNWPGMHESWLGDGICHDSLVGCYNTAICQYDGGDCCADTCKNSSSYATCGHDGFACRDPGSKNCNPRLSYQCDGAIIYEDDRFAGRDDEQDWVNVDDIIFVDDDKSTPDSSLCGDDAWTYKLIMYDSFGDGWDTTRLFVTENNKDGKMVVNATLEDGAQGTKFMCLKRSTTCYHVEVRGGVWGNEVSWEVKSMTGATAIASGGAPMSCDFALAGGRCNNTCTGKSNVQPSADDEDYTDLKALYKCITKTCPIQVGACQADKLCDECFDRNRDVQDSCFELSTFNALVDCSLCGCSNQTEDRSFCDSKVAPGTIIPDIRPKPSNGGDTTPCTPAQTLKGGSAVLKFGLCTGLDQVAMMATDFDQDHFGHLDDFERCAHEFNDRNNNGDHKAMECLNLLYDTSQGKTERNEKDAPPEAIQALAKLLYTNATDFCECAKNASDACPLCPAFYNVKTLLYESLDACQALDEIDCAAWSEFYEPCRTNMESKFGTIDFGKKEQCEYIRGTCGGAGAFPAFRRIDCEAEVSKAAWTFYYDYESGCLKGGGPRPAPAPAPGPDPKPSPVSPTDRGGSKPYVPPEDRGNDDDGTSSPKKTSVKGSSHWFRNLVLGGLLAGGVYYYCKRRSDGFSFVRFRPGRRGFGMDGATDSVYSALSMEGSTNFEPASLPPRPDEYNMGNGGGGGGGSWMNAASSWMGGGGSWRGGGGQHYGYGPANDGGGHNNSWASPGPGWQQQPQHNGAPWQGQYDGGHMPQQQHYDNNGSWQPPTVPPQQQSLPPQQEAYGAPPPPQQQQQQQQYDYNNGNL